MAATLLHKLQVKPGARLWLIDAPADLAAAMAAEGHARLVEGGPCDAVVAFCESPAEVAANASKAIAALPADGLLWFGYRKGAAAKASGLSRDVGWAALSELGYRGVRSIAFDDAWTGLRFREISRVKAG